MDEHRSPHIANEAWNEQFARALAQQRERLQQFDDEQGGELERIESQLTEQFEAIGAKLEKERHGVDQRQQELDRLAAELDSREESLQQRRAELEAREARLREGLKEAKELEQVRIAELEQQLREGEDRFAAQSRELEEAQQRLNELQNEVESLRGASEGLRTELADANTEALDSLAQRDAELQSLRGANESLQTQLDEAKAELTRLVDDTAVTRSLEDAQRQLHDELAAARETSRQLEQKLAAADADRQGLLGRVAELEEAAAHGASPGDSEELRQLQSRLDMALDDIRELKARNAKLEADLARASQATAGPAAATGGLDWEAEKRRIMAALEADDNGENALDEADRVRVEEAIRTTEQIVAEKDRLIEELTAQIAQAASDDNVASETAAVNHDEVVLQERDRLKQLQAEWQEKLRQAEVDLSVERAKVARERAEIEEKLRTLASHQADAPQAADSGAPPSAPSRPTRGRWLARLGLKDDDES